MYLGWVTDRGETPRPHPLPPTKWEILVPVPPRDQELPYAVPFQELQQLLMGPKEAVLGVDNWLPKDFKTWCYQRRAFSHYMRHGFVVLQAQSTSRVHSWVGFRVMIIVVSVSGCNLDQEAQILST